MKNLLIVFLVLLLCCCSVVDSSSFNYLEDENLELHHLLIIGADQDVEILLPKSLSTNIPDTLFMKPEGLELSYSYAIKFPYEWQWGGPIHKNSGLYLFELGFTREKGRKLLNESFESRIQNIREKYSDIEQVAWREYVLKNYIVYKHQSKQGYQWVSQNLPTVMRHHELFSLPISDESELIVWFWYNEDWVKDHPEWYERRKALSRRILDTVRLSTPN